MDRSALRPKGELTMLGRRDGFELTKNEDGDWTAADGSELDPSKVATYVGRFTGISASDVSEATLPESAAMTFVLADDEGEQTLSVFALPEPGEDGDDEELKYVAVSDRIAGAYDLSKYIAEQMDKTLADLGPDPEEDEDGDAEAEEDATNTGSPTDDPAGNDASAADPAATNDGESEDQGARRRRRASRGRRSRRRMTIDLYTWPTPNGRKVSIALEELGLDYEAHPVNIGRDEQFAPDFLAISPNNKIPAIVDRETGRSLMESGAILLYLSEKTGELGGGDRWTTMEWLMLQMGGVGPMLGQANHFLQFNAGKSAYAEARYGDEAKRLYGVLDRRLAGHEYLAGDYSIADIATWPWISRWPWHRIDWADYPSLARWYRSIAARPAVGKRLDGAVQHRRDPAAVAPSSTRGAVRPCVSRRARHQSPRPRRRSRRDRARRRRRRSGR